MKNYTNKFKDRKTFITHYKIKNNKIIIYYATGLSETIPYTRESEKRILEKMKRQVLKYKNKEANTLIGMNVRTEIIIIVISVFLGLILLKTGLVSYSTVLHKILILASIISFANSVLMTEIIAKEVRLLKDIRKNRMFLENEKRLSNIDSNELSNVLKRNVRHKTKRRIKNEITLNSIHKMRLEELRNILEELKQTKEVDYTRKLK